MQRKWQISLLASFLLLTAYSPSLSRDPLLFAGMEPIGNHMSIHATEVNLDQWCEFIISNGYDATLYPDENALTDGWTKAIFNNLKAPEDLNHLKRRLQKSAFIDSLRKEEYPPYNYPITGITYEQAIRFCHWKEQQINEYRPADRKIKISLPSIETYKAIIVNSDSLYLKGHPCFNFMFNYKHPPCGNANKREPHQGQALVRVDAFWPTKPGVYCLQGNAAEMTSTKGVAMGGSFRHYARQSENDQIQSYSKAEDWLGFRYVATLD
jgi:Sulfatase-modifying factor enzyme 1